METKKSLSQNHEPSFLNYVNDFKFFLYFIKYFNKFHDIAINFFLSFFNCFVPLKSKFFKFLSFRNFLVIPPYIFLL